MKGEIYMKIRLLKLSLIGFSVLTVQHIQAAAIQSAPTTATTTLVANKQPSPIEKALEQLKRDESKPNALNNDKLKVKAFASSQKEPTQHFFAEQNQHFSRLLQNIFQSQGS